MGYDFFWHRNRRVKIPVAKTQISILVRDKVIWNSNLKLVLHSLLHSHTVTETERQSEIQLWLLRGEDQTVPVPFYSFFLYVSVSVFYLLDLLCFFNVRQWCFVLFFFGCLVWWVILMKTPKACIFLVLVIVLVLVFVVKFQVIGLGGRRTLSHLCCSCHLVLFCLELEDNFFFFLSFS